MGSGFYSILDNMSDHGLGLVHKPVPMILHVSRIPKRRNDNLRQINCAPFTHLVRQQS